MDNDAQSRSLVDAVGRFIDERSLIPPGGSVVMAVSGGADSVALLAVLRDLAGRSDRCYSLTVGHLNHCLRAEADGDAGFVADLAGRWGLACVIERRDVAALAKRTKVGIEQAARTARYEFLQSLAGRVGADRIAVAHHADDNVETVLHRIVRGTHLRGLAGIGASRLIAGTQLRIVRPLLELRRERIEAFCLARGLSWRTDATNADTSFARNFIRHELLPLLRDRLNVRADEAIQRLSSSAEQVERFLAELARKELRRCRRRAGGEGCLALDARRLSALPPVLRTHTLRMALEEFGAGMQEIGADRLAELSALAGAPAGSAVSLPGGVVARRDGPNVEFRRP